MNKDNKTQVVSIKTRLDQLANEIDGLLSAGEHALKVPEGWLGTALADKLEDAAGEVETARYAVGKAQSELQKAINALANIE